MKINHLPKILARHSEYAMRFTELTSDKLNITFNLLQNGAQKISTLSYLAINNTVFINLSGILFSLFDSEDDHFEYTERKKYTAENSKSVAKLLVTATCGGETIEQTFFIINAALQTPDDALNIIKGNNDGRRLGIVEYMPMFTGYPMSSSILRDESIDRILNTSGCGFNENISNDVTIQMYDPLNIQDNDYNQLQFEIQDKPQYNGTYIVTFTSESGQEVNQTFTVVNAGATTPQEVGMEIRFKTQNGTDVGNFFVFKNQSYQDIIVIEPIYTQISAESLKWRYKLITPSGQEYNNYHLKGNLELAPYIDEMEENPLLWIINESGDYQVTIYTLLPDGSEFSKTVTFNALITNAYNDEYQTEVKIGTFGRSGSDDDILWTIYTKAYNYGESIDFSFPYRAIRIKTIPNQNIEWVKHIIITPNGAKTTIEIPLVTTSKGFYLLHHNLPRKQRILGDLEIPVTQTYEVTQGGIYRIISVVKKQSEDLPFVIDNTFNIQF